MSPALRYLEAVLPATGLRVIASKPPHWNKGFKHDFVATNEALLELSKKLDLQGVEHWVALATYADPEAGRKADNTVQLQCLWIDLDYKNYPSQEDALAALEPFYKAIGYPSVTVQSGGGIHAYWALRTPMPTVQWKILAEAFQAKWQSFEIKADPISADAARVLRLPGTHNRKYDPAREVVISTFEDVTYDPSALMPKLGVVAPKAGKAHTIDVNDDLGANLEQRPSYIEPMLKQCLQLQHAFTHQAEASEPYWYATIQVVRHVENGRAMAHAFSNQHPGYSKTATDDKLDQLASKDIGPTTCAKFKQINASGCKGCQFAITSPIQLGYKEVEAVEPTITVTEKTFTAEGEVVAVEKLERPAVEMPHGFKFDGQAIYRIVVDEETKLKREEPILAGFICPERLVASERQGHNTDVQLFVQVNGQPPKRIQIPAKAMSEKRDISRELHSKGVFFMAKDSAHILELLQRMTQTLQRQRRDAVMAEQMGWQEDNSFVVGSTAYKGKEPPLFDLPVPPSTKSVVKRYEPVGSLDQWKKTAEVYNRPGGEPYQFALLYGAAGVFLPLAKVSGVMLSLYSQQAGRGKSTAGYAALSWWGDPDGLKSQSKDTNNALFHKASRHKNLPILMDEVTDKPVWELEDLVYFMTQGREKESLTSERVARPVLPGWALPAISTSNNSLRTKLQARRGDSQGLFARIIELSFDLPFAENLGYSDRMVLRHGFAENFGHAGPLLVRYAQENKDTCESIMDQFMVRFDTAIDGDSAYRFWVASCAATMTVLTVARHLGLVGYDITALSQWAVDALKAQRTDAITQIASSDDVLAQFLEGNANRIVVAYQSNLGANASVPRIWPEDGVRGSELVGRVEVPERSLYLSMPAFIRFCNDKGFDVGSFVRNAAHSVSQGETLLKKPQPVEINLGKGTKNASARMKALEFNLLHPALREFAAGIDQRVGEATNIRSVK
jgi:hypothetical protein